MLVLGLYKEDFFIKSLNVCPFDYTVFAGEWEGLDPVNRFNHTSWVAIAIPN